MMGIGMMGIGIMGMRNGNRNLDRNLDRNREPGTGSMERGAGNFKNL